ncbi:MAG: hypothetical protein KGO51_02880 [Alphaproteobacteria bacterium]|nr:hypothetical protein [Alphaproteobacteria bacterium]
MTPVRTLAAMLALAGLAGAAHAQPAATPTPPIRAQALVEQALARHPDLKIIAFHVTPPGGVDNVIIASNIGRFGKKADADDMAVLSSGKPRAEVTRTGYSVELPLRDAAGRTLGVVGETFAYQPGDDTGAIEGKAEALRDELAAEIPDHAWLFAPRR